MSKLFFLTLALLGSMAGAETQVTGRLPLELKSASLENVFQCLPKLKASFQGKQFQDLELLKTELEKVFEFKNKTSNYRWMELRKESQKERVSLRLNRLSDGKGGYLERMQIYRYDSAAMPQEVKILKEHQFNPSEKILKSYLEGYEIISDEKAFSYLLIPGWSGTLKYLGANLQELELVKLDGSQRLTCRETDMVRPLCQCL